MSAALQGRIYNDGVRESESGYVRFHFCLCLYICYLLNLCSRFMCESLGFKTVQFLIVCLHVEG